MKPSPTAAYLGAGAFALCLLVLLVAPILAGIPPITGGLDLMYQAMLGCLLLLAGTMALAARRLASARERLATPVDGPVLLLLGAAALSTLFSVNRHASVVELLRVLSQAVVLALAAALAAQEGDLPDEGSLGAQPQTPGRKEGRGRGARGPREAAMGGPSHPGPLAGAAAFVQRPAVLWGVLAAGAGWAGLRGVWEYADALRHGWDSYRVFGGFHNPNALAGHLALTMPLMAGGALALRSRIDRWRLAWPVPAALLAVCAAAATFTGSRLGLLAAGFGLGTFALLEASARRHLSRRQMLWLVTASFLAGVATVLAVPTLRYRFFGVFQEGFSLGFRFTTWAAALRIFSAHPLAGTGAGTFGSIMTRYSDTGFTQSAHNHFLQTASETGVAGLAGLVSLLVVWVGSVARGAAARGEAQPGGSSDPLATLARAALAGVLASALHACVDIDWSVPATGWAAWAILGAGLGAAGKVHRAPARPGIERAALALLLLALLPGWRIGMAAGMVEDATYLAAQDPAAAETAYREALRLDPYSPDIHREFGRFVGGLGLATGDAGRLEEGRQHLRAAIHLAPTQALNAYHLGLLEMRSGRTRAADAAFRRALVWDPQNPYVLRHLGQLHERTNWQETVRLARRLAQVERSPYGRIRPIAERVDPDYAFAHYWLALEHTRAGRHREAVSELRQAQRILKAHRASLQGQGGIDFRGERRTEPDADVQALEKDVARALRQWRG